MLGPMFALLLLTSPAAGPVDQQSCWLLCPPAPTTSQPSITDTLLGQDPASLNRRVTAIEQQQQSQQLPNILAPAAPIGIPPSYGGSSSPSVCAALGATC